MKKLLAFIVDVLLAFVGLGYIIAVLFGQTTGSGFSLSGISAFILFLAIILYGVLSKKYFGQSLGRKIVGVPLK